MLRALIHLAVGEQFLDEFLARAGADELDVNVAAHFQAAEPDEVAGQLHDRHRLAHVQDEDLAALADGGRLQDQLHGLGDGHKVAAHVRVGDGDRAAAGDLFAEDACHTAVAAQHVAEAHGCAEERRCGGAEVLGCRGEGMTPPALRLLVSLALWLPCSYRPRRVRVSTMVLSRMTRSSHKD